MDLLVHLEPVSLSEPDRGRRPLADTVHGEHGRRLAGGREERAGGVALMVLGEEDVG
jgi:hypothetical protein